MSSVRFSWPSFARRLSSSKWLLLLLDYDGTLVPIVKHPAHAKLPKSLWRLLRRLADRPRTTVALISGRALHDLKQMVGVDGVCYVGNHGLEAEGHGWRYVHPMARKSRPLLWRVARQLKAGLRSIQGAWLEDKQFTLTIHWRGVPRSAMKRFQAVVRAITTPYVERRAIRLTVGKWAVEVRPSVRWGKGDMVAWLRRRLHRGAALMVYLGDDQTDEEAFRTVNRYRGVSVIVGKHRRTTDAREWLRNPREVHGLLTKCLDAS